MNFSIKLLIKTDCGRDLVCGLWCSYLRMFPWIQDVSHGYIAKLRSCLQAYLQHWHNFAESLRAANTLHLNSASLYPKLGIRPKHYARFQGHRNKLSCLLPTGLKSNHRKIRSINTWFSKCRDRHCTAKRHREVTVSPQMPQGTYSIPGGRLDPEDECTFLRTNTLPPCTDSLVGENI